VTDFKPLNPGMPWTNGIVGAVPDNEVGHWFRLHRSLVAVSATVTLPDLSCFQLWVPRIRRFSYVLSPTGGQPAYS
jgi:hypothetical protein